MTTTIDNENDRETIIEIGVRGSDEDFREEGRESIEALERGESIERPDRVTFPSEESLARTINERTIGLLRHITENDPESIRETARLAGRDVKNVHDELTRLEAMGIVRFDENGRAKRPVFPYDELHITVPFDSADETPAAAP